MLPRGPLREPQEAARRAHAVVFTRSEHGVAPGFMDEGTAFGGIPAFCAVHEPMVLRVSDGRDADSVTRLVPAPPDALRGRRVVAFAGIADNARLLDSLKALGAQ
ncbi:MAG: tetraacyldisaccharide 4'-kinase, partial [Anaerolineae bacterium]